MHQLKRDADHMVFRLFPTCNNKEGHVTYCCGHMTLRRDLNYSLNSLFNTLIPYAACYTLMHMSFRTDIKKKKKARIMGFFLNKSCLQHLLCVIARTLLSPEDSEMFVPAEGCINLRSKSLVAIATTLPRKLREAR